MEELFSKDIEDISKFYKFSEDEMKMLNNIDKTAEESYASEFEHYLKHEFNKEALESARKHGILGIPIDKEYGGSGMGPLILALAEQRLGQMGLGFATFFDVHTVLCSQALQLWGTDGQKDKYLRDAASGSNIFAFAITETSAGSDPSMMKTSYVKENGRIIINGTKYLISNGSIADTIILFAKSSAGDGITAFLVDTKSEGFDVSIELKEKLGLFTSPTSMIEFSDVEVGTDAILGEEGKGLHVAYSSLINGRMGIGGGCIGIIEGCLSASVKRARERVQHGKAIGKHQLVQDHIAEIRQNLEMARWPVYFAAMKKSENNKDKMNKELMKETDMLSSLAKRIASRRAFDSADRAVQIFGGFGYSLLSPVGPLFCDSRVARIYEGTDEIQELKIASAVLGEEFSAFR